MNNYIERVADINKRLEAKSLFLFGPRQTGKSSYIKHQLEPAKLSWTLLDNELYRDLSMRPSLLRNTLRAKGINDGVVVLDEIQRLPDLLNEVHMLIEETDIHFLLTALNHPGRRIPQRCGPLAPLSKCHGIVQIPESDKRLNAHSYELCPTALQPSDAPSLRKGAQHSKNFCLLLLH